MQSVEEHREVGAAELCGALGVPRASFYRRRERQAAPKLNRPRPKSPRALTEPERQEVLEVLHSEAFVDRPPAQVYAALLDEGRYLCSPRTMYRILEEHNEVRERRNLAQHPAYAKPELLATKPNQVWSWDITKLKGPVKWTYFYLYVILDIFSRYTVGWMVAPAESAALARRLIDETCAKQEILPEQLTLHADRGSSMKSKCVAMLLADLGITKSHSRPYTSDDNPFSESQFKTLKYRPEFPTRFGSIQDARAFCVELFHWYNTQHYHSAIGWLTPEDAHYGRGPRIQAERQKALDVAYLAHPERFVRKPPAAPAQPTAVWINPPKENPKPEKRNPSTEQQQDQLLPNLNPELSQNR